MAQRPKSRMVTVSLKKNLFGKKKTAPLEGCKSRSSMGIGQAQRAAFAAGKKSGSTTEFNRWLCDRGLNTRSDTLKTRLRQQYARGVEGEPHTSAASTTKASAKYKGYRIKKLSSGSYYSPGIDGGKSRFDGLPEIKAFIDSQAQNPPSARFGNFKIWQLEDQWGTIHNFESQAGADQAYNRWTDSGQTVKRLPATTTAKIIANRKKNPRGLPVATQTQGKAKAQIYKKLSGYRVVVSKPGVKPEELSAARFAGAMTIARIRLHEVATAPNGITPEDIAGMVPGVHVATVLQREFKAGRKRSKNPISAAEKMYEEFHGTPSTEVIEYITQEHRHSVTAALGKFVSMKIIGVTGKQFQIGSAEWLDKLKPADIVQVATSEDGRQLFLKGGEQELKDSDLSAFGFTDADKHDHMLIGTIKELTYRTKKTFERKGDVEVDFFHVLGKEGSKGIMPVLVYHPRNKNMTIAGGRYRIAPPARELGNVSPGIVG